MKPRSAPAPAASPLALGAIAIGACCVSIAGVAVIAGVDVPDLTRRALARGQGAMTPAAFTSLSELQPLRLVAVVGLALLAVGAALHWTRAAWRAWLVRIGDRPAGTERRDHLWVAAITLTLLLGLYHPTLTGGFFRYDDFEILSHAAREPLERMLLMPVGDHLLPLGRFVAWAAVHTFGAAAWPWNLAVLSGMAGALLVGARLLEELGVNPLGRLLFVALAALWSPWAEILSGYYILSCYVAIAGLGLGAWLAYLRWRHSGGIGRLAAFFLCLLLAPTLNISGLYVVAAGAVFIGIDLWSALGSWRQRFRAVAAPLTAVALVAVLHGAWLFYAYVVLHPGVFLGMAGAKPRSLASLALDLAYVFDVGLLVSFVAPFVYARLPTLLLLTMSAGVLLFFLGWLAATLRAADRARRGHLLATALVLAGICLMIVLGRPTESTFVVRWAAKHVGPAYLWLCIFLVLGWDALWRQSRNRPRLAELSVLALAGFIAVQSVFDRLGLAVDFPPFGYPAELRDAGRRRTAVARLNTEIMAQFPSVAGEQVVIPTLDGPYLRRLSPGLFLYNLSHYEPFFGPATEQPALVRGPGMQTWTTSAVRLVPNLAAALSPEFLKKLSSDAALRGHYLAEVPLTPESTRPAPDLPLPPALTPTSPGEFSLRAAAFPPDTAPRLRLWLTPTGPGPLRVTVVFDSEIVGGDWQGVLELPAATPMPVVFDLRQVYAFSLGGKISRLHLVLPATDAPLVHLAELTP